MSENRGKQFEEVIKEAFEVVPNVSVTRLHDQTTGYLGSRNICDFIIYKKPYQYFIECKSVHGNTFPFSNITKNQWDGMLKMSSIDGVFAGVICWWVDRDVTKFIPIQLLNDWRALGQKSVRYDFDEIGYVDDKFNPVVNIEGKKKRVFFEYDMKGFFNKTFDI